MTSVGSLGVGSGLDLNGLLDKIGAAERAPLSAIRSRQSSYNARISSYGAVRSMLDALKTAAGKLADPVFMNGMKSSSSAQDVLTVSSDATAVAGSHAVSVSQLARSQTLASTGVASASSDLGAGAAANITIEFGSIAGTLDAASGKYDPGATFTPDAGKTAVTLSLASGQTSLEEVRDAINKAAAGALSASIVNDGSANRLVLTSTATGAASSMKVSVSGNAELATLLATDPAATQAMQQTVQAQDAALKVDGIAVTSHSNTVTGAIQGVTLTLAATGGSTVEVERDTASVQAAVNGLVSAYNNLHGKIAQLTAYDAGKKTGGGLVGDNTLRAIESRLRETLFQPIAGAAAGAPTLLSDVGMAVTKDGSLQVDAAKLGAALAGAPDTVARLFAGDAAADGAGDLFSALADAVTRDKSGESEDGILTIAMSAASKRVDQLDEQYDRMDDHIQATLDIYRKQFQQLDAVMSSMTSTSNYLTQVFARTPTK